MRAPYRPSSRDCYLVAAFLLIVGLLGLRWIPAPTMARNAFAVAAAFTAAAFVLGRVLAAHDSPPTAPSPFVAAPGLGMRLVARRVGLCLLGGGLIVLGYAFHVLWTERVFATRLWLIGGGAFALWWWWRRPRHRVPVPRVSIAAGSTAWRHPPAIGPSPLAWDEALVRSDRHHYAGARYHGRPELAEIIRLRRDDRDVVLLLGAGCHLQPVEQGRALLWWEDRGDSGRLKFHAIDLDNLPAIQRVDEAAARLAGNRLGALGLDHAVTREFNTFLAAGIHGIDCPESWSAFTQSLVVAHHAAEPGPAAVRPTAVFCFDWVRRQVTVLPQDWFNHGKYNFSTQWINRVARTATGHIVGEGVRLPPFELDASGRNLRRTLGSNPFA